MKRKQMIKAVGMKLPKHNGECDCGQGDYGPKHHLTCRGYGWKWTTAFAKWAWTQAKRNSYD